MALHAAVLAGRRAALSAARRAKRGKHGKRTAGAPQAARGQRKKRGQSETEENRPSLFSGEGVAMMAVAVLFDFIPPVVVLPLNLFFGLGELASWPIDILGTIVLGGWMWARSGEMTFGKKLMQFLTKRGWLIALEYVPLAGEGPWWTINVFLFLKK